jgi:hypothetical protein
MEGQSVEQILPGVDREGQQQGEDASQHADHGRRSQAGHRQRLMRGDLEQGRRIQS